MRSGRPPRQASDEALRRDDGRHRRRRGGGRPRAARARGLVAAVASGAARDHPCRAGRTGRARRAARDSSGRAVSAGRQTTTFLALTLIFFSALTAIMTYPQVLRMRDGVHDPGDPLMVTWVLAWVAH